jgi:predicted amidohydrolase YtcJ
MAGTAAAAVGATLTDSGAARAASSGADLIFHNGTILTMIDDRPQVTGVAVKGGRIFFAGDEGAAMALKGDATKIIDLSGATLMPSFIDAHGHFMNAPQIVKWANVSGVPAGPVRNIPDIIEALKAHKAKWKLRPGDWIIGYGYDMTNLAEGRQLTRDDLDPTFPDNPVMLIHSSNHGCVLNSAGFKMVGIDVSTKTPPGGLILRKPGSEEPEGLLMETAFLPIFAKMPMPSEPELLDTLDAAQQIYASVGITTVQEGATHASDLAFLRKGAEQGRLYLDVVSLPLIIEVPKLVAEYFPDFGGGPNAIPDTASASASTRTASSSRASSSCSTVRLRARPRSGRSLC